MNRFRNELTRKVFDGIPIKGIPYEILRRAVIKLTMVEAATDIRELAAPPSNRLEKLKDDRAGQWSIRVNDKYRICFIWEHNHAGEIEFTDYL
ncbi:MAG: type II toxin-antitoxin system RelE/ParE family toxin [Treponema sp.]|nr:type II toxin-antitoxin system RelE/ParE family toxin [Treponema sp.]